MFRCNVMKLKNLKAIFIWNWRIHNDNIMMILNIFICNVFILYRDYILNLLNYVIFYLIILNWFTKLFLYGIEIMFLNIKYIYMV